MASNSIDLSNYTLESSGKTPLSFKGKTQSRFELGVCLAIYKWETLDTAVENQWGGADSGEKRDWLVGSIVELFDESYVDSDYIEERLLQVMGDEFDVQVEDDSALPVAVEIIEIYRDCQKGDFSRIEDLHKKFLAKEELKAKGQLKSKKVEVQGDDDEDDDDDYEDCDEEEEEENVPKLSTNHTADVEMEDQPTGPIIDDDGFELVQKKGRGRKR